MMRPLLVLLSFVSTFLFPWPLTALVALGAGLVVPLIPLSVGLLADALYWAPGASSLPVATLAGAFATVLAYVVQSRLATDIIT